MNDVDEVKSRSAERRLQCVRQIVDADPETLLLVSSILDRVVATVQKIERKRRGRRPRDDEKGGAE